MPTTKPDVCQGQTVCRMTHETKAVVIYPFVEDGYCSDLRERLEDRMTPATETGGFLVRGARFDYKPAKTPIEFVGKFADTVERILDWHPDSRDWQQFMVILKDEAEHLLHAVERELNGDSRIDLKTSA